MSSNAAAAYASNRDHYYQHMAARDQHISEESGGAGGSRVVGSAVSFIAPSANIPINWNGSSPSPSAVSVAGGGTMRAYMVRSLDNGQTAAVIRQQP